MKKYQTILADSPSLWEQIWLSQNKRCASCGEKVVLNNTAKSSYSLKIVCQDCYDKPRVMIILDEWGTK